MHLIRNHPEEKIEPDQRAVPPDRGKPGIAKQQGR
jgi:hypothetical protein